MRQAMGVRIYTLLMGTALVTVLPSCSPIYSFQLPANAQADLDTAPMRARLEAFVLTQGFEALGRSDRATGDIGCGRSAPDRTTFEKRWRDTDFFKAYHWVWVHQFSCDGAWHAMIVSSTNAEREAAELRDRLSAEFATEITSGALQVETRHRIALE